MPIYIQSRGKNQDQDYRWLLIKSDKYYSENPSFLMQPIENSTLKPVDLIESQKQSIILVADQDNYYLLVTGLKARDRNDFAGRSIRNSVLWMCQKDNENVKVRSLLIRALEGELEQQLDETINASGRYGFEVDYKSLVELSNSALDIGNNHKTDLDCKIGNNSESLRRKIISELQISSLPDRNGLLMLVTSIKSAPALIKTGVWRGLSDRIEGEELEEYSSLKTINPQAQKKTVFLGIAIALVLAIAIALIIIKLTTPQQPQPQINPSSSSQKTSFPQNLELLEQSINCIQAQENNYFLSPCSWNASKN